MPNFNSLFTVGTIVFGCIVFICGLALGLVINSGNVTNEVIVPYRISPAMTITCYDSELQKCDTIYTYREHY